MMCMNILNITVQFIGIPAYVHVFGQNFNKSNHDFYSEKRHS